MVKKKMPYGAGLNQKVNDMAREMFVKARGVCRKHGYNVGNLEILSDINWAVAQACLDWRPELGASPSTLACDYALKCLRKRHHLHRKVMNEQGHMVYLFSLIEGGEAGKGVKLGSTPPELENHPLLNREEFEILSFIAHHGRHQASHLLGWNSNEMYDWLHKIEKRLQKVKTD